MLVDYTKITGAVRAYKYDIPDSALGDLTPFAKSMVNYAKKAKKIYRFSSSQFYNDNIGAFDDDALYSVSRTSKITVSGDNRFTPMPFRNATGFSDDRTKGK